MRDYGERLSLECRRCGKFKITRTAATIAEQKQLGPNLPAWIRERSESGAEIVEIDSNTLKDVEAALPTYRVSEKLLLLLRAFERRSSYPGEIVDIVTRLDYTLAWAAGAVSRFQLKVGTAVGA